MERRKRLWKVTCLCWLMIGPRYLHVPLPGVAKTVTINTCSLITQSLSSIMSNQTAEWTCKLGQLRNNQIHFMRIPFDAFYCRSRERFSWCFFFLFFFCAHCWVMHRRCQRASLLCTAVRPLTFLHGDYVGLCSSGALTQLLVASRCSLTPLICVITRRLSFIVPFSWIVAECGGKHYHFGLSGRSAPYAALRWLGSVQDKGGIKHKVALRSRTWSCYSCNF